MASPSSDASAPKPPDSVIYPASAWSELSDTLRHTLDRLDAIDRRLESSTPSDAIALKITVDNPPERVEQWQQWVSLGATVLAVSGVLWAVSQPQEVAKWARQANIVSIGPEGFAFGQEIEATETTLQVLAAQRDALDQLAQNPAISEPEATAAITQSLENLDQLIAGERQRLQTLDRGLQDTEPSPSPSPGSDTPAPIEASWLLVIGADATPESAQDEVKTAQAAGYAQARTVWRDGWYRSVIPFASEQEAQIAQANLKENAVFGDRGIYIKPRLDWCPNIDFSGEPATPPDRCTQP